MARQLRRLHIFGRDETRHDEPLDVRDGCLWFGVWGLGFGIWGLGFGVWTSLLGDADEVSAGAAVLLRHQHDHTVDFEGAGVFIN